MSAQHTPGPWRVEPDTAADDVVVGNGVEMVAVVMTRTGHDGANAALITAAPDLLAALRLVSAAHDGPSGERNTPNKRAQRLRDALRTVDAAIARAEGRE